MKKLILTVIIVMCIIPVVNDILPLPPSEGGILYGQVPMFRQKRLYATPDTNTTGDTTFNVYLGTARATYKWCRATLYNPTDTLTDSVQVFHVVRFELPGGLRDSVYNRVGFWKLTDSTQQVKNDTVYYIISLAAGESIDVLIAFPYVEGLYWDMFNAIFDPERDIWVKNSFLNE